MKASTTPATPGDIRALYELHSGELHGYLYRRAGPEGADLLAEVFVVALRRLDDLPEPALRRAWLFGVARRLLLAQDRNAQHRLDAETERARIYGPDTGSEDDRVSDQVRAVRQAVASLREPERELLRLTEWERLPVAEAAAILGIRIGTARVRLHRARQAMATHPSLQGLFEQPPDPQPDLRHLRYAGTTDYQSDGPDGPDGPDG